MNFLLKVLYRIHHPVTRGLQYLLGYPTLGVRGMVMQNNKVLLVKHSYTPGWHFPGGGVDRNETPLAAVKRELFEEVGITCTRDPQLFSIYHYTILGANDYPIVYVVKEFEMTATTCLEIAEIKWFDINELPHDIHTGTATRIQEYLSGQSQAESWR